MSDENPNQPPPSWRDFIANVSSELDALNQELENVCNGRRRGYHPRSPRSPRNAMATPRSINTKLIAELEKRRAESPKVVRPEKDAERELMSNYKYFPPRKNASARIFKPDKLKYEMYRNNKRIVPVLTGSPMKTYTEE